MHIAHESIPERFQQPILFRTQCIHACGAQRYEGKDDFRRKFCDRIAHGNHGEAVKVGRLQIFGVDHVTDDLMCGVQLQISAGNVRAAANAKDQDLLRLLRTHGATHCSALATALRQTTTHTCSSMPQKSLQHEPIAKESKTGESASEISGSSSNFLK